MPNYLVQWEIDINANNPVEAAKQALEIMRDHQSIALIFDCLETKTDHNYMVDLEMETTTRTS